MKLRLRSLFLCVAIALLIVSGWQNDCFAQARLVLGNTTPVYMVMNSNSVVGGNPIYLVVGDATGNDLPNTITRNSGWIISEGENNILKWYIGNNIANYTVPWGYSTTNYIPLQMNKTNGGTANAYFQFSTYHTTHDNSSMMPSGMTSCNSPSCGNCNAEDWMVDRFWMIDNSNYGGGLPQVDLTLYYVDGGSGNPEVFTAGTQNTNISGAGESNLQMESYNSGAGAWTGTLYGTDYPGSDYVGSPGNSIAPTKLYKWWAIVDKAHPLPVTWLDVSAECNHENIAIRWSTASEQNSNYFTVERSLDGTDFSAIATKTAAGNSSTVKNYSAVDTDPYSGTSFYRVSETDFNGSVIYSSVISVSGCADDEVAAYGSGDNVAINIIAVKDGQYNIELYDILGQKVMNEIKNVTAGSNSLKLTPDNIASAIYVVRICSSNNVVTKKVLLR